MGDAGQRGSVVGGNRRLHHRYPLPCRSCQHLHFELVSSGDDPQIQRLWQRVNPESALGIGQLRPAGHTHPEVGKVATLATGPRRVGHFPPSHHDDPPVCGNGRHQLQGLDGVVLAVGIDGDGIVGNFSCCAHAGDQGSTFSPIVRVDRQVDA